MYHGSFSEEFGQKLQLGRRPPIFIFQDLAHFSHILKSQATVAIKLKQTSKAQPRITEGLSKSKLVVPPGPSLLATPPYKVVEENRTRSSKAARVVFEVFKEQAIFDAETSHEVSDSHGTFDRLHRACTLPFRKSKSKASSFRERDYNSGQKGLQPVKERSLP
jgi:hypothetical protein